MAGEESLPTFRWSSTHKRKVNRFALSMATGAGVPPPRPVIGHRRTSHHPDPRHEIRAHSPSRSQQRHQSRTQPSAVKCNHKFTRDDRSDIRIEGIPRLIEAFSSGRLICVLVQAFSLNVQVNDADKWSRLVNDHGFGTSRI